MLRGCDRVGDQSWFRIEVETTADDNAQVETTTYQFKWFNVCYTANVTSSRNSLKPKMGCFMDS